MINLVDLILIVDNVISDDESELLISEFERRNSTKEKSREVISEKYQITNADFVILSPKTIVHQIVNDKTNMMVGHYKDYIKKSTKFSSVKFYAVSTKFFCYFNV